MADTDKLIQLVPVAENLGITAASTVHRSPLLSTTGTAEKAEL